MPGLTSLCAKEVPCDTIFQWGTITAPEFSAAQDSDWFKETQKSQRVSSPHTRMIIGAARLFTSPDTALWRYVCKCKITVHLLPRPSGNISVM